MLDKRPTPTPTPTMLRAVDIALDMRLTTNRIYSLIREYNIPTMRIGRALYVPAEAWAEFKAKHLAPTPTGPGEPGTPPEAA